MPYSADGELACLLQIRCRPYPLPLSKDETMTSSENQGAEAAFVARVERDFAKAFRVLKETRTLSATHTFQAYVCPARRRSLRSTGPTPGPTTSRSRR